MPVQVTNVTLGLTGASIGLAHEPGDEEALAELFAFLSDRRALLYSPTGRPLHHAGYVTASIQQIREELLAIRKRLDGDDAKAWVDAMAKACRTYLTAVDDIQARGEDPEAYNFETALRELREFFRDSAKHFRTKYGLSEAQQLVKEMYAEDRRRLETEIENEGS